MRRMSTAKLTMLSFHRWMTEHDNDLFKNLNIPEGIDKDNLVNNILLEGADFEVLYSDPIFMSNAIGIWSAKWYRTFEKWLAVLSKEYDPLQNYNGDETTTTVHGAQKQTVNFGAQTSTQELGAEKRSQKYGAQSTSNAFGETSQSQVYGEQTDSSTYGDRKATSETDAITNTKTDKVSAYDSADWSNQNQATDNLGAQKNTTTEDSWVDSTRRGSHTDSTSNSAHTDTISASEHTDELNVDARTNRQTSNTHTDTTDHDTYTDTVTMHREGNLGVTSSQKMLTEELEVQRFNLIQQITDLFLNEFCIMIYI